MYRLMKSEKITFEHKVSGRMSFYRQIQVSKFQQFSDALAACEVANDKIGPRHYLLNRSGKEYHGSTWID